MYYLVVFVGNNMTTSGHSFSTVIYISLLNIHKLIIYVYVIKNNKQNIMQVLQKKTPLNIETCEMGVLAGFDRPLL